MDRRAQGLLLLALALLAALIVPNLGDRTVPGLPRAAALPGPPGVGDCLLTPLASSYDPSMSRRMWSGVTPAYGTCPVDRIGEVVQVETDAGDRPLFGSLAYRPSRACADAADAYVGLPLELTGEGRAFGIWAGAVDTPTVRLAPSEVQRIAGQRWAACVVLAEGGRPGAATSRAPLRDLFRTGSPPDGFGWCTDTADPIYSVVVDCDIPHQAEDFGFADHLVGTDQAALDSTCRDLVVLLTRMPDPTAGGALTVEAATARYTGSGGGGQPSEDGFALCQIAAPPGRALTGTLLGLGTGEIPWA